MKKSQTGSKALWIPFIWMFLSGSRYVSQWLSLGSPIVSADAYLEGSPVDRAIFLVLILAAVFVLVRRRLQWSELLMNNWGIWLFFIFGVISIGWSDYPDVSFKRWIKTLGTVCMALVILTEERPYDAIGIVFRRLAFILVPLSILFIKYYPEMGRAYHMGQPMFTGVSFQKNGLGELCMIFGIYFCWALFFGHREGKESDSRPHFLISILFLTMIAWLTYMAGSATALACLSAAIGLLLVGRLPVMTMEPPRILWFCVACIVLYGITELVFDVKGTLIAMLGRKPDFTSRVPMWEGLIAMNEHPFSGYGWESFWLGERLTRAVERWGMRNAHNGYLELYLNLGLMGLLLLLMWIFCGLKNVLRHLTIDYPPALLRLSFILVVVLFSWTEISFFGLSNMLILLTLGTMDVFPRRCDGVSYSERANWQD